MTTPLFEARNVVHRYRQGRRVLEGLDWDLRRGDFAALIGPNGVGKSTLLRLMSGWLVPVEGSLRYKGRPVGSWNRRAFAREVAVVPQREEGLFPFTASEVVRMGRYPHQFLLSGTDDEEDRRIAQAVLRLVGLEDFGTRRLAEMSGGERQLVLFARALAQCPEVLLLDEPTTFLDPAHQRTLFQLLDRLHSEGGLTILVVSHDINLAGLYCSRLAVMAGGRIAADGSPEEVLRPEVLEPVYGTRLTTATRPDGAPMLGLVR